MRTVAWIQNGSATCARIPAQARHLNPLGTPPADFPAGREPPGKIGEKLAAPERVKPVAVHVSHPFRRGRFLPRRCLPRAASASERAEQHPLPGPAARGPAPPPAPTWRAGPRGGRRDPRPSQSARAPEEVGPACGQVRHARADPGPVGGGARGAARAHHPHVRCCGPSLPRCRRLDDSVRATRGPSKPPASGIWTVAGQRSASRHGSCFLSRARSFRPGGQGTSATARGAVGRGAPRPGGARAAGASLVRFWAAPVPRRTGSTAAPNVSAHVGGRGRAVPCRARESVSVQRSCRRRLLGCPPGRARRHEGGACGSERARWKGKATGRAGEFNAARVGDETRPAGAEGNRVR
ncbi:hypothetical protein PVAP13_9KG495604 [Panicum virgatum]|uniref:Uncharacterized protein n=1 Tax=Panicum virgatum TaxID=38727 RepID=A0A8T0NW41_PANVG|nr:hypothetical protein PVAP13_9KG495604 [Panicum virgatum]